VYAIGLRSATRESVTEAAEPPAGAITGDTVDRRQRAVLARITAMDMDLLKEQVKGSAASGLLIPDFFCHVRLFAQRLMDVTAIES